MKRIWPYLLCLVFDALLLWGAWELGRHSGHKEQTVRTEVRTQTDTIVRRDTITVRQPVPYKERVLPVDMTISEGDSLYAEAVADTTRALPLVQREYGDSSYTAWVSGYDPRLDSIKVFPRTVTVLRTETRTQTVTKRNPLSLGLTVGAGYGVFTRQPDVFVGVGLTWKPWK